MSVKVTLKEKIVNWWNSIWENHPDHCGIYSQGRPCNSNSLIDCPDSCSETGICAEAPIEVLKEAAAQTFIEQWNNLPEDNDSYSDLDIDGEPTGTGTKCIERVGYIETENRSPGSLNNIEGNVIKYNLGELLAINEENDVAPENYNHADTVMAVKNTIATKGVKRGELKVVAASKGTGKSKVKKKSVTKQKVNKSIPKIKPLKATKSKVSLSKARKAVKAVNVAKKGKKQ